MTTTLPTFAATGLAPALVSELAAQGISAPFPIQAATIPDSLAGRDVLGRGRTGSGKTLAFGLPLLHRTAGRRARPGRPLALVLVPTRELAAQVTDALAPYAATLGLRCATVVGGLSLTRQAAALRAGAEVLVATPGRLHDLIDRGDARLDQVTITVLDEADQMADMGFLPQVTKLLEQVAPGGQRMLFSATLDRGVDRLVRRFLTDPVTHSVDPGTATVTAMTHHVLHLDAEDKPAALAHIAAREGRTIVFIATKHRADRVAASCSPRAYARRRCTVASRSRSAPASWSSSAPARSPRWWPPTWRPGASTSTGWTWSSTPTRPPRPRTTCTGAAGPPGLASRALW